MKNSQRALAASAAGVLALAAGASAAADVTVFGRMDTGISISEPSRGGENGTVEMKSGIFAGSRFGILTQESLTDDLKLVVKLENAFDSSTGEWNGTSDNRIFGRESSVSLIHEKYGTLAFGRIGMVTGGIGSYSSLDWYEPFETGFTDASLVGTWADLGTVDKTILYKTPTVAGFNAKFQFAFTDSTLDADGNNIYTPEWSKNARPWGAAFEYRGIPNLFVGAGVGGKVLANTKENRGKDDPILVNFAINYDFGFVKPFFAAQYSDNFGYATGSSAGDVVGTFKKTAYLVGITAPAAGGLFRAEIQYLDGEEEESGEDYDKQIYAIGYTYPLSKRTLFYSALSYAKGGGLIDKSNAAATNENRTMLEFGIDHQF